jgi:hypothetical protein
MSRMVGYAASSFTLWLQGLDSTYEPEPGSLDHRPPRLTDEDLETYYEYRNMLYGED